MRTLAILGLLVLAVVSSAVGGQADRRLPLQRGQIAGVAFSPDGKYLATVTDGHAMNGDLRVWDVATGAERTAKFDHPSNLGFSAVAWSPDGQWVATAYWKQVKLQPVGFIALLHAPSGNLMNEWRAHEGGANSVSFSADSSTIASGGADGLVRLWDVKTNKERRALRTSGERVYAVAFSPDGRRLAAINGDGTLSVWDAAGKNLAFAANRHKQLAPAAPGMPTCRALAFSPDSNRLATGDSAGNILVWDLATARPSRPIHLANPEPIRVLAYRPGDQMLAVAMGSTIRMLDPDTGHESSRLGGYSESVYSIAYSPDGSLLAAGDRLQVHLRSTQFSPETSGSGRSVHWPQVESSETPTSDGLSGAELEPDRGPWVVAVGACILVVLLGTIVMVCRRG
jgi:WD40 repeat protein